MSISRSELIDGLTELSKLSLGEYHQSLEEVLFGTDEDLAFKRIGRLMAVWLKRPFAQPSKYDPNLIKNWAKSLRSWDFHDPPTAKILAAHQSQYDLLEVVAAEWKRPVDTLHEYQIFRTLCKPLHRIVWRKSRTLHDAKEIARRLEQEEYDFKTLATDVTIGAGCEILANQLVKFLPWLTDDCVPLIAGFTFLVIRFGVRKLRKLISDFEKSDNKSTDEFRNRDFPLCGSVPTKGGKRCRNRVREKGTRCWRHRR